MALFGNYFVIYLGFFVSTWSLIFLPSIDTPNCYKPNDYMDEMSTGSELDDQKVTAPALFLFDEETLFFDLTFDSRHRHNRHDSRNGSTIQLFFFSPPTSTSSFLIICIWCVCVCVCVYVFVLS